MEGGATGATASGLARFRSRRERIRREPIDLDALAAELADPVLVDAQPSTSLSTAPMSDREILVALEAEVERVQAQRTEPEPVEVESVVAPEPVVSDPTPRPGTNVGLPLDQVRAWLEQVEEDLHKIEARVEYLQAEQTRLQTQHQLVAELLSSSTPV